MKREEEVKLQMKKEEEIKPNLTREEVKFNFA